MVVQQHNPDSFSYKAIKWTQESSACSHPRTVWERAKYSAYICRTWNCSFHPKKHWIKIHKIYIIQAYLGWHTSLCLNSKRKQHVPAERGEQRQMAIRQEEYHYWQHNLASGIKPTVPPSTETATRISWIPPFCISFAESYLQVYTTILSEAASGLREICSGYRFLITISAAPEISFEI